MFFDGDAHGDPKVFGVADYSGMQEWACKTEAHFAKGGYTVTFVFTFNA